jgi:hypothetical protein
MESNLTPQVIQNDYYDETLMKKYFQLNDKKGANIKNIIQESRRIVDN